MPLPQESSRRLFMDYYIEGQHPLERVEATVDRIEAFLFDNQEAMEGFLKDVKNAILRLAKKKPTRGDPPMCLFILIYLANVIKT